jgi:hypothetical protein
MIEEIVKSIRALPPEQRAEIEKLIRQRTGPWAPTPGPQQQLVDSKADIALFGGSGGGGKTDTLLGLAFTQHRRSLIIRRHYVDLGALTERAITINRTRDGFNGSTPPKLRTRDGRLIEFGGVANLGDEQSWQGQAHDFLGIDEAVQLLEAQVRFLMGWVRSTVAGQRCRIVLASNPPIGAQGDWIISFFAPWLDPRHANPAKPGELRWFVVDEEGRDREVDGPTPVEVNGRMQTPLSRTFIPATVDDNPFLASTNYKAQLDALPEPLRSAVRDGNFMAARVDDASQVIPTAWVRAAQARWRPHPPTNVPMCAIGVDVARSADDTVLAIRYDGWYAPLVAVPGRQTPHGTDVAALVVKHRRGRAAVIVDCGEGTGGMAYQHLRDTGIEPVTAYRGMDESIRRTVDKQLAFFNKRSEAYWRFREALDPGQDGGSPIALPDDPKLVADLTAPTWELSPRGIKVEPKAKVVDKLGRSPDRGDAIVMAWSVGDQRAGADAWMDRIYLPEQVVGLRSTKRSPVVNFGPRHAGVSRTHRR